MIVSAAIIAVALSLQPLQSPKEKGGSEGSSAQNAATPEHTNKPQEPSHSPDTPTTTSQPSERSKPSADHDASNVNVQRNIEIFTGVLAGVGALQLAVMFLTWLVYRRQAGIMEQQRATMQSQWTTMQDQLAQMESGGKQTDRLIEKAGQQIGEMAQQRSVMDGQLSAMQGQLTAMQGQSLTMKESLVVARGNVEAGINEKRARIRIEVSRILLADSKPEVGQLNTNMALVNLFNYGQTTAFIDDFRARFIRANLGIEADFSQCRQFLYGEALGPNARTPATYGVILEPSAGLLSESDIMSIRKEESFLHFYALVDYRDVYERTRTQTIHVYWKMRWGGMVKGQAMEWWEAIGPAGDNEDSEYKPK